MEAFPDWVSIAVAVVCASVFTAVLWLHWESKWEAEDLDRLWADLDDKIQAQDELLAGKLDHAMPGTDSAETYLRLVR